MVQMKSFFSRLRGAASTIFMHEIGADRHADSGKNNLHESGAEAHVRFIVLIILLLLVLGALPAWPYSTGWGYYPSGIGLIILIVVAVLLLRG
jgi:hypothetical protein